MFFYVIVEQTRDGQVLAPATHTVMPGLMTGQGRTQEGEGVNDEGERLRNE